ncbi:MAG: cytochrome c family protein, partial [Pseudomonadota bacterium]
INFMSGSNLEFNKLFAALLIAGLIAMFSGKIASFFFPKQDENQKRGYQIEVVADAGQAAGEPKVEEKIDIVALMASANAEKGMKVAKKCVACHAFNKDGAHKIGPMLWNVVGAKMAKHGDYPYSDALQNFGGNWGYEELFAFMKKPKQYIKGTKMSFIGLKKPEQIADLVEYLRQQSDNPVPLPTE